MVYHKLECEDFDGYCLVNNKCYAKPDGYEDMTCAVLRADSTIEWGNPSSPDPNYGKYICWDPSN